MATAILLVGCGKMGRALLEGWLATGTDAAHVHIVEPGPVDQAGLPAGIGLHQNIDSLPESYSPNVVVFAVKPQIMGEVAPAYKRFAGNADTVFLSIAAGRTIGFFEGALGSDAAIVRAMPNTPAAIRRGITVLCANSHVGEDAKKICATLLDAVGETAWVAEESLLDAVTAVSGSGPAYIFLLSEAMAAAGIKVGLPADIAERLARATVAGAGELLRQSSDSAGKLRQNVTSPGGTTEAALSVLMAGDGLVPLMEKAIKAATDRSRELAG